MSDPFSINGGSVVALVGKDCVGIACDLRLGQQALTISTDFPKIFPMGDKVFLGLAGLATDVQTLYLFSLAVLMKGMSCSDSRRICIDCGRRDPLNRRLWLILFPQRSTRSDSVRISSALWLLA